MLKKISLVVSCLMLTLTGCGGAKSHSVDGVELTVFLKDDATADERGAIESRLRKLPEVGGISFETRQAAYQRFKEIYKSQPDLVSSVSPDTMPESFRVSMAPGYYAEASAVAMRSVPGVDEAVIVGESLDPNATSLGFVVYLEPDATAADRKAIEAELRVMPSLKTFKYESRDLAFRRLTRSAGSRLKPLLDKKNVAASFRVEVSSHSKDGKVISRLQRLDPVDVVAFLPISAVM